MSITSHLQDSASYVHALFDKQLPNTGFKSIRSVSLEALDFSKENRDSISYPEPAIGANPSRAEP